MLPCTAALGSANPVSAGLVPWFETNAESVFSKMLVGRATLYSRVSSTWPSPVCGLLIACTEMFSPDSGNWTLQVQSPPTSTVVVQNGPPGTTPTRTLSPG